MSLKRIAKWTASIVMALLTIAFLAFLYFVPPFTFRPPEAFSGPEAAAAPALDHIPDAKTRALAERGKYIVTVAGCTACHTAAGPQGPKWDQYLAGGSLATFKEHGTFVSANLTPDPQTGLARRSDDEVKRVLRSGVSADGGRIVWYRDMPWAWFSNWTEEDRHAVVVYLRNIKPVARRIPAPSDQVPAFVDPAATEQTSVLDWGTRP